MHRLYHVLEQHKHRCIHSPLQCPSSFPNHHLSHTHPPLYPFHLFDDLYQPMPTHLSFLSSFMLTTYLASTTFYIYQRPALGEVSIDSVDSSQDWTRLINQMILGTVGGNLPSRMPLPNYTLKTAGVSLPWLP